MASGSDADLCGAWKSGSLIEGDEKPAPKVEKKEKGTEPAWLFIGSLPTPKAMPTPRDEKHNEAKEQETPEKEGSLQKKWGAYDGTRA